MSAILCAFYLASCLSTPQAEDEGTLTVIVSILPQAEFVERVGGEYVRVTVMVPSGASPHTYEPTPRQLKDVSKAALYVTVGSGLEFELSWSEKIISMNEAMLVVDCSRGIELIPADEHGTAHGSHPERYDPHIWLSVKNAQIMVENIFQGLIQVDPSHREYYARNKDAYIEELEVLDSKILQVFSGKDRKILVYHPSWAYFCRDYGLQQIPIEEEGKEPTPQGIAQIIAYARENSITVIFASPQFNTESASVIAAEIGGTVVFIDPLDRHYIENMWKIALTMEGEP